jgi:hypothetical protein
MFSVLGEHSGDAGDCKKRKKQQSETGINYP